MVITVWIDNEALDSYRSSVEKPGDVLMFARLERSRLSQCWTVKHAHAPGVQIATLV